MTIFQKLREKQTDRIHNEKLLFIQFIQKKTLLFSLEYKFKKL